MKVVKQVVALIALSVGIIAAMSYAQHGIQILLSAHDWVSLALTDVFSVGQAGNIARGLIALLTIPVFIAIIPAAIYWLIRRHFFPYFLEIVWVVWLIQAGALMVAFKL